MAGNSSGCVQTSPQGSFERREHLTLFLILLATLCSYATCISYGFVYDDNLVILQNPQIRSWASFPSYFTEHVFSYNRTVPAVYYRPVFLLWLRIQYWLFGPVPAPWHAINIVLHLLATALVFKLAKALSGNFIVSTAAALLFGLHPSHVESVAWIDGCPDPLAAVFVLGSFLLFLRYEEEDRRAWMLIAGLAFFACGLLTKEGAIVLPALLGIRIVLGKYFGDRRTPPYLALASYVALAGAYLLVRQSVLSGTSPHLSHTLRRIWHVLLSQPKVLWFYASHLLFPWRLSESYPIRAVGRFNVPDVLLPTLALALVAALFVLMLFRLNSPLRRTWMEAVPWLLIPLLPVLDLLLLPSGDYVHDRYLYLPSVGFCLLLGVSVSAGIERLHPSPVLLRSLTIIGVSGLALATAAESRVWRNDETLYRRTLAVDPQNATMRNNLASYFIDQGRIAEAIPELQRAIADNPRQRAAHVNLAICYEALGELGMARDYWQRAENIAPDPQIEAALARLQAQISSKDNQNAGRVLPNGNGPN